MATKKVTKAAPKAKATPKAKKPAASPASPQEGAVSKALSKQAMTRRELQKTVGGTNEQLTALLQKLKRKGQIKKVGRQWVGTSIKVCPHCKGRGWIA